jgi:hypothetical protein
MVCSTCEERKDTVYIRFWWGDLRERTTWKTGVDGRIILMDLKK